MAGLMKLTCLVLACMIVTCPLSAKADISCFTVSTNMIACLGYLTEGGSVPASCCNGVRTLNNLASSTPDRQQACRCLQGAAISLGPSLNPDRAAGLPKACGIDIPYAISPSTNCDNVK